MLTSYSAFRKKIERRFLIRSTHKLRNSTLFCRRVYIVVVKVETSTKKHPNIIKYCCSKKGTESPIRKQSQST